MPNWCENDLTITGPTARVDEFLTFAKSEDEDFDFNRFVPYPKRFEEQDRLCMRWYEEKTTSERTPEELATRPTDGYNSGGYEWCIENWGTKWPPSHVCLGERLDDDHETSQALHFDTAWSPPVPVVKKAAELFPDLTFDLRYFECGCAFNGWLLCRGGEVVMDECGNYYGNRGG